MKSVNKTFAELVESASLLVPHRRVESWRISAAVDISWEMSIKNAGGGRGCLIHSFKE